MFHIGDLAERGDCTAIDHVLTTFEQRMRASRDPFLRWRLASFQTALALLEGRYPEAETLAADALALGQAKSRTAVLYRAQIFPLRGEQARFAEVEPLPQSGVSESAGVALRACRLLQRVGTASGSAPRTPTRWPRTASPRCRATPPGSPP